MVDIGAILAIAGLIVGSSGALWYRMGQIEESVKRLPCRDQRDCPEPKHTKEV